MTTSLGIQLTAGQKCLIDLLQRKLLNTVQLYARLTLEKQQQQKQRQHNNSNQNKNQLEHFDSTIDVELFKLKEKIKRISARQKRFTLEIINKNGNNTIPKESFFEALGLVTKEALSKLNSKSNERRRRTTANPRFSHEAIQAKRAALEAPASATASSATTLHNKRSLESRLNGQNNPSNGHQRSRESARKSATVAAINQHLNGANQYGKDNQVNNNDGSKRNFVNTNGKSGSNQQIINNNGTVRSSSRTNNNNSKNGKNMVDNSNNNSAYDNKRRELLAKFGKLQKQVNSKVNQVENKRESNRKLMIQNELIRKRGLEIISAINMFNSKSPPNSCQDGQLRAPFSQESAEISLLPNNFQPLMTTSEVVEQNNDDNNNNDNSHVDQSAQSTEPLDIWIDMKCDESLDGLD